jgi:hypothetical protein
LGTSKKWSNPEVPKAKKKKWMLMMKEQQEKEQEEEEGKAAHPRKGNE